MPSASAATARSSSAATVVVLAAVENPPYPLYVGDLSATTSMGKGNFVKLPLVVVVERKTLTKCQALCPSAALTRHFLIISTSPQFNSLCASSWPGDALVYHTGTVADTADHGAGLTE